MTDLFSSDDKTHPKMAATAGRLGSRKGLAQTMPRLTGKAATVISRHISDMAESTDEGIFATGLLLCNMWKNNKESLLPYRLYDMDFISAKDDPVECIEDYLQDRNVDVAKLDDIIENSIRMGYITYDPVPYVGDLLLLTKDGDVLDYRYIASPKIIDLDPDSADETLKYVYMLSMLTVKKIDIGTVGDEWDWNTLILMSAIDHRVKLDEDIRQKRKYPGVITPRNIPFDITVEEALRDRSNAERNLAMAEGMSEQLDDLIKNMIIKETIIHNGVPVAKVVLTWD